MRIIRAMVLLCYDGSDDSKAAIDRSGTLLKSSPAMLPSRAVSEERAPQRRDRRAQP